MARMKVLNGPSIRRMPIYLYWLSVMQARGDEFASTTQLAEYIDLEPINVRKDIALTGVTGTVGVGYRVGDLIAGIRRYLGWDAMRPACLVGVGALGRALLGHREFQEAGLKFTCVFDSDEQKIGTVVRGHEVLSMDVMAETVAAMKPEVAVICVPAEGAQKVVDDLVDCGIKSFWSFSNVSLRVPEGVFIQREVIAGGYAMLSVKLAQMKRK